MVLAHNLHPVGILQFLLFGSQKAGDPNRNDFSCVTFVVMRNPDAKGEVIPASVKFHMTFRAKKNDFSETCLICVER